jgi:hypothetical protein
MYASIVGHLGCFHRLAIINSAAINMGVQVSLLYPNIHSFEYIHRSGFAGFYDSSDLSF